VTFGEDRSRLRCGHAPQIMAALRNLSLTRMRRTGTTQIAEQRRCFAYHQDRALALLCPTAQAALRIHRPFMEWTRPPSGRVDVVEWASQAQCQLNASRE
jgi:hypothetical protein